MKSDDTKVANNNLLAFILTVAKYLLNSFNVCVLEFSVAHSTCSRREHGLLYLTAATNKNVERLVSLKNESKSMKDRLALAIEKRKEILPHSSELY